MSPATLIILIILLLISTFIVRNFIQKKGSCKDCDCSCPIKDEIRKSKLGDK